MPSRKELTRPALGYIQDLGNPCPEGLSFTFLDSPPGEGACVLAGSRTSGLDWEDALLNSLVQTPFHFLSGGTTLVPKFVKATQSLNEPDLALPRVVSRMEVPMPNGFGDIFGDIGAFFTTEQTFGETLSNVGYDVLEGFRGALPAVALPIAEHFLPAAPRSGQPSGATPRPSIPELFLPEFLRPSQRSMTPTPFAGPPGRGGWPEGSWESDTFGEPFTFPAPQGGMAMAAGSVMLPAVRGMGTLGLQATVQAMRSQGIAATVSWLAGIIRKWGPAAAVGFLASWVEGELAQRAVWEAYSHKRRRMNPANTKALRRSLRRLNSFDRLCSRVKKCRKSYKCI